MVSKLSYLQARFPAAHFMFKLLNDREITEHKVFFKKITCKIYPILGSKSRFFNTGATSKSFNKWKRKILFSNITWSGHKPVQKCFTASEHAIFNKNRSKIENSTQVQPSRDSFLAISTCFQRVFDCIRSHKLFLP